MTEPAPRRQAAAAVAGIRDAQAAVRGVTAGLDPRLALAPDVERERLRLDQVAADRYREAAALIPKFEAQLASVEPEHCRRIQAAHAATVAAFEAWQASGEAEAHEQAIGNSVVDGLCTAIALLRTALAEPAPASAEKI